ncbi:MAG: S4 domain-containing protein, partial [Bacilli bacterium]
ARQLVNHGHITVNGKKVDIPSYRVKINDVIALKDNKQLDVVNASLEKVINRVEYIAYDETKKTGTYLRLPERSELNQEIDESLIVEFYNR